MRINTKLLGVLSIAAAGVAVLAAEPSQAAIINAAGVYDPLNPCTCWKKGSDEVDIYPDSYFQNSGLDLSRRQDNLISDRLAGFNEQQAVQLGVDIWTNIDVSNWENNPQDWNQVSANKILSNTPISSHYFWFMPELITPPPPWRTYVTVEIEFSEEIIGVIGGNTQLGETHSLLGLNNVVYSNAALDTRILSDGQLSPANDVVRSIDGRFLTIYINSSNGLDTFRVVTKANPVSEPLTILGAATAIGFGAFFKRELSMQQKKNREDAE